MDILLLVGLTLVQNFFIFNNEIYSEDSGLATGSNYSPLLVEIFMLIGTLWIIFFKSLIILGILRKTN